MAKYSFNSFGGIEIDFEGFFPSLETRNNMKSVRYQWNPSRKIWWAKKNDETLAMAKLICEGITPQPVKPAEVVKPKPRVRIAPTEDYALKLAIKDIVSATRAELEAWETKLRDYVNAVMTEDNSAHSGNAVSGSQESVWMNCFRFIANNLKMLPAELQEYELIFEYSLPGTVHERPDVFLLTNNKVISLEFKKKEAPQVDSNKDDVAQAIRYKEWIENHHKVTRDRKLTVKSYLVCTHAGACTGELRGIEILTKDNFCELVEKELVGEVRCSFTEEWLASPKTEMPDMLQAIEIMYREGRIPYISDVNEKCLNKVLKYISNAKAQGDKLLMLINGVPGAGKTAVGQSVVFEENKCGAANAVYLSGNGPLVEVLQYQLNQIGGSEHVGENAIQGMKEFKTTYFYRKDRVPQQAILIFDEAQRAWDPEKLGKDFSEPEGLFRVGEKIFNTKGFAVLIGLYGNGQVIYTGEEAGMSLWRDALKAHSDWKVVAAEGLAEQLGELGERKQVDNDLFLPVSLRADFIDCSKWVEQAIGRNGATMPQAILELQKLQNTSMRICVTRDYNRVKTRMAEIDADHPEWNYGMLLSNFAVQSVVRSALPGWNIGYKGANAVALGQYGPWFAGDSKNLAKACSVYGNQGLELDCPIVLFGGEYIRKNGEWVAGGYTFESQAKKYKDPYTIVENNFRVLLTRARKEMILLIPSAPILDETYRYFVDMGMDEL